MKKKLQRLLSLMLAVLLLAAFCGCGSSKDPSSSQSSESEGPGGFDVISGDAVNSNSAGESSGTADSGKEDGSSTNNTTKNYSADKFSGRAKDLGGKTITVHMWQAYMNGGQTSKPKLSQKALELNAKIEKELNCKLKFVESWTADVGDASQLASVAAGKPNIDIWWVSLKTMIDMYSNGYLVALDSLKVMDFADRDKFTNATEMAYIDGHYYGVGPKTYGIIPVYTNQLLVANVNLLKNCGVTIDELRSLQSNKKWNWDNFRSVCEKVKMNNGKNGYNTYALADDQMKFYQQLMTANGSDWISRSSDGKTFTFTGGDAKGQKVLKYYSELVRDGLVDVDATSSDDFQQGKSAFMACHMFTPLFEGSSWNFEYTFMYPPMGDDATKYNTASGDYTFAVIPKGTKPSGCTDAQIATVLDMLNTPLLTDTEDSSMAATDMAYVMKNQLAKDTVMGIYKDKQLGIIWSSMATGIGLTSTKDGWYSQVKKIAKAGGTNMAGVISSVSSAYNSKLKNIWD